MKTLTSAAIMLALIVSVAGQAPVQTDQDPVATVSYCELIKHPKRYDNKVVRVTGVLAKGFEKSSLSEEFGCDSGKAAAGSAQSDTWVSYDKAFVLEGDSGEARLNQNISGFGRWWLTAVGRFRRADGSQRFGHLRCCKYEFALIRIEQFEELPTPKR